MTTPVKSHIESEGHILLPKSSKNTQFINLSPKPFMVFIVLILGQVIFNLSAATIFSTEFSSNYLNSTITFVIAVMLGATLLFTSYGFTGTYRRLMAGHAAEAVSHTILIMITTITFAVTIALFGEALGISAADQGAPASWFVPVGGLLFMLGMQISGGCASGHVTNAGEGEAPSWIAMIGFAVGASLMVLAMPYLEDTSSAATIVLFDAQHLGLLWGTLGSIGICMLLAVAYLKATQSDLHEVLRVIKTPRGRSFVSGPWSMIAGILVMAVLNALMLALTGGTWGASGPFFWLPARILTYLGVDLTTTRYWGKASRAAGLTHPISSNAGCMSDWGMILGAGAVASLAGRWGSGWKAVSARGWVGGLLGGALLGVGSRVGYGCNVGAGVSAISATSVHAWMWLGGGLIGTLIGVNLRPLFGKKKV
eukprot:gnl/Dysnectes_brevis/788_a868_1687.p1 GENE.gnl/Dysnectes_brevis/788_a868_1687~~gnl/Dysnectes_brevis/788_a868_1687.p1  ORF type:complete len:425 (+),score=139.03 gnl/Dysnectes_brevis/788_a868_1687:451-1725(+)